jgi:hypothetical protein
MRDEEFSRYFDDYLEPPVEPNPELAEVQLVWERGNPKFAARHILEQHGITEDAVEQVLLEIPPFVEARRHPNHPNRTVFWGATRHDRWIVVICEDWPQGVQRFLRPITAFEPAEGVDYWESFS